ncbi:MAG: tandem-95 repeat protein, partial [Synechococcaceae cyanobacterium SM2_3_1]|nr:tandem-95 repeat protein [Synechococcaceae cyanobacterium SM2_3_1]
TATIPYTVSDDTGLVSNQANISVTIGNNPVAVDDVATTAADTNVTFSATDNDSDPDNNLDVASVDLDPTTPGIQNTFTIAGEGVFTVDDSGNVTFDPDPTFTGTATIPYTVSDDTGLVSNQANISVTIGNNPVAVDDVATTAADTNVTFSATDNDSDPDGTIDPSTVDLDPATPELDTTVTLPGQGTFTVDENGIVTFSPEPEFTGTVSIPYIVRDNDGLPSNIGTITVTIGTEPVANDDTATTTPNTPVSLDVTSNDSDPDGSIDPTTIDLDPATSGQQTSLTLPGQGTLTVDENGLVTFIPDPDFVGTVMIPYTVRDNDGLLSNPATITIVVGQPPTAVDNSVVTLINTPARIPITNNDFDPDGDIDPTTVDLDPSTPGQQTSITVDEAGTFTVNETGLVTFTPVPGFTGSVEIPYTVNDNDGLTSNTATITVTISSLCSPHVPHQQPPRPPESPPPQIQIPLLPRQQENWQS